MTENNGDDPRAAAANDDESTGLQMPSRQAGWTDDPCGEAGFDAHCCDATGARCPFHARLCHAPDYPCLDMLRHRLALEFLEQLAGTRGISSSAQHRGPR